MASIRWSMSAVGAAILVTACVAGSGSLPPERLTCAAWVDELRLEQRERTASAILAARWRADGSSATPPSELVKRFADAIGALCRSAPTDTVGAAGDRVYVTLDEAAPPAARPGRSTRPSGPELAAPDEPVMLEGPSARAEVAIAEVEQFARFHGAAGDDVPADDHVFVQLHITYTALTDDVAYSPADWQLFADGLPAGAPARVNNGPEPLLAGGVLAAGERALGYVVFDAPASGELILAYVGRALASAEPYQVVIRDVPRPF